jgi:predicted MFS family arabinose efflux permease
MLQRFLKNYLQSFSGLPRGVWFLSLAVLINRSGTMVMFFLSLYVTTQLDFSVLQAGSLVTYYGLGAIGGAFAGGWASDKIAPKTVQIWSLIATGLGFIVLGQLGSYNDFVFGMLVQGFVAETFRPANAKAIGLITNATTDPAVLPSTALPSIWVWPLVLRLAVLWPPTIIPICFGPMASPVLSRAYSLPCSIRK